MEIKNIISHAEKTSKMLHEVFDKNKVHIPPYIEEPYRCIDNHIEILSKAKESIKNYLNYASLITMVSDKAKSFYKDANVVKNIFNIFKDKYNSTYKVNDEAIILKNEILQKIDEVDKVLNKIKLSAFDLQNHNEDGYGKLELLKELPDSLDKDKLFLTNLEAEIGNYISFVEREIFK